MLELLAIQPDDIVVDGTVGYGGHAAAILEKLGPEGRYIGIDQDPVALAYCRERFASDERVAILEGNFSEMKALWNTHCHAELDSASSPVGISVLLQHQHCHAELDSASSGQRMGVQPSKILLDLGMSSVQLDSSTRGFSYLSLESALDMRMSPLLDQTAADILNGYSQEDLENLFRDYGELYREAKPLTSGILGWRRKQPFEHVQEFTDCIKKSLYFHNNRSRMLQTFARIFQALRIEVNQELVRLEAFLKTVPEILAPGGRLAILTFHSLEDRMVKHWGKSHEDFSRIVKKAIQASQDEIRMNSRAKSAKLRGYEKRYNK